MVWLPNAVTLLRLPLAAWVVVYILNGAYGRALLVLMVAGLTDGLDGLLARHLHAETRFGAYLDPIADKILLVTVFLCLGWAGLVPHWLVWIVVGRDILILAVAGAMMGAGRRRDFAPSVWGKLSTLVQIAAGLVVLGSRILASSYLDALAASLVTITAITTAWSGLYYAWRAAGRFDAAKGAE